MEFPEDGPSRDSICISIVDLVEEGVRQGKEIVRLRKSRDAVAGRLADATDEIARLEQDLATAHSLIDTYVDQIEGLEAQLAEARAAQEQGLEHFKLIVHERDELKKSRDAYAYEIDRLKADVQRLVGMVGRR